MGISMTLNGQGKISNYGHTSPQTPVLSIASQTTHGQESSASTKSQHNDSNKAQKTS